MKKFYLIFFICASIPLFTAAQQKELNKQSQAPQQVIPTAPKATTPAKTNLPVASQPSKPVANHSGKGGIKPHKRKISATTTYGNEWINYTQRYFKIKVVNDGYYRIDSATLAKAGIPVNTIANVKYQLYFRGQQQYIFIRSKTITLSQQNGDYIEFFGQKNDGVLDSTLYTNIKFVPNPYFSLFNDTSTYYLTWGTLTSNNRMATLFDTLWHLYPTTPYVMDTAVSWDRAWYFPGPFFTDGTETPNDPRFMQGTSYIEGSVAVPPDYPQSETYNLYVDKPYNSPGAPKAFLRTVMIGEYTGSCTFSISNSNIGNIWVNVPCNGFADTNLVDSIPGTNITSNVPFNITYTNNETNLQNIIAPTYAFMSYARNPDMNGESTRVVGVPYVLGPKTQVDFTNIPTAGPTDTIWMYDMTYHNRIWVKPSYGAYKANIPVISGVLTKCYIGTESSVTKVTRLIPVGINKNGVFTPLNTGPDSAYIIITSSVLDSGAEAYKAYRSNTFHTVLANVDELYDQFGYGVDYSPLGIRRFCNYAIDKWPTVPSNLFIIGKGIHSADYRFFGPYPEANTEALVPSYGFPSSDILFTAGLDGDSAIVPAVPTGRLAALNNNEVALYLSKVKTYESAPAALWMKNVAHFVGGDPSIEPIISSWMSYYASIIQDTLYGAKVFTFTKTTPAILTTLTDSIINLINNGVSIMTFFGHAGGSDWDVSVDYPSEYQNYNKYPFMIADACFSGDIYAPIGTSQSSVSEQWVLNPPGAIGFLASDYLGEPANLDTYTTDLYNDISHKPFYGKSIGSIVQNTIEQQENFNEAQAVTCLEMTLHGDPAIALNAKDSLPDYAVNDQSVYFTPAAPTVLLDSFDVHVIVSNYGEAVSQNVAGILTRYFPNGNKTTYNFSFYPIWYQDTVTIRVPVDKVNGPGLNYFTVSVNLTPKVWHELTYNNNAIALPGVPLVISSEDITPIWPYDFAIIPQDTVTLKASTNDPFAPVETYIFEIDTSHKFNSSLFQSVAITNSGGVIMASPYANWGTTHYKHFTPGLQGTNLVSNGNSFLQNGNNRNFTTANPDVKGNNSIKDNSSSKPGMQMQNQTVNQEPTTLTTGNKPLQSKMIPPPKDIIEQAKMHRSAGASNMLPFINNKVYYWRVRRNDPDTVKYPWAYTSFQYIKNKNGWGQSDFYQYINDEQFYNTYNFIDTNTKKRDWVFYQNGHTLECFDFGVLLTNYDTSITDLYATEYKIDNVLQAYAGCQLHYEIDVAVMDPITLQPWTTQDHPGFGNINDSINYPSLCSVYPDKKFIFWADDSLQMVSLVKMLKTVSAEPNTYLLSWSWVNGVYKYPNLKNANAVVAEFASLGATQMPFHKTTPGMDSVPFIFFTQIGNPASTIQKFGTSNSSSLYLSTVLKNNGSYGALTSPLIGPSKKYDSLSWHQHSYDRTLTDSTRLNIIGVEPNGNTKTLLSDINPITASMYMSSINTTLYPYIQLQLYTKDAVNHTPGQMNWWRVFYQPVPEIAMNPNVFTYYHADTIAYGDTMHFQTTVQNISDWPIDSTQLLTWVTDQSNNTTFLKPPLTQSWVKALNPGQTTRISSFLFDTVKGANSTKSIWFEVNPEDYTYTRLEQYHFNDYAHKSFYSFGDKINPVLDVTFDGIHILNNDIVSPTPNILITFMDENKYLAMNNPTNFQISYRNINSTTLIPVNVGPTLSFSPAVLPHNRCSFVFTPTLADGTYELDVQGKDASGNFSAANTYKIDFQVINKSMISEVLNYPNPFSTSTRFVFILTGDKLPTSFKIQVMTVTGKIVREIDESEIGPIHIGRNITQYAWDGTDQFGSKLANGVYLYRVISSINGQSIDDYQTAADKYFTKSWGKMYLMR